MKGHGWIAGTAVNSTLIGVGLGLLGVECAGCFVALHVFNKRL